MSEAVRNVGPVIAKPAALGGASVGVVGSLLWHFSLTPPGPSIDMITVDAGSRFVQPPLHWWPTSMVIVAAAAVWFGLVAYTFHIRMRSRAGQPAWWVPTSAAAVAGGLFGLGLATVARWFPPQLPQPDVVPGISTLTAIESARASAAASALDLPVRIQVGEPLLTFPLITAVAAVVVVVGVTLVRRLTSCARRSSPQGR